MIFHSRQTTGILLAVCVFVSCILSACGSFSSDRLQLRRISHVEVDTAQRADLITKDLPVVFGNETSPDDSLNATAMCVFDLNGTGVYLQKNVYKRIYPASLTKLLTALLALENLDPEAEVTVGDEVVITETGASLAGLKPGDRIRVRDLLYGLLLPSGNDAAQALAALMSDDTADFAAKMNARARELGAWGTHFENPHGLHSEDHYTTVYDLYLIFREDMKHELFRQIISSPEYTASILDASGTERQECWHQSNRFINGECDTPDGLFPLGGKTGTTSAAGSCLVHAVRDSAGKEYVAIAAGASTRDSLYSIMMEILKSIPLQ